jgi:hypothetical protein
MFRIQRHAGCKGESWAQSSSFIGEQVHGSLPIQSVYVVPATASITILPAFTTQPSLLFMPEGLSSS